MASCTGVSVSGVWSPMMTERLRSQDTFVVDFVLKCKCGNCATHLFEVHAADSCTEEEPNLSQFMCRECLDIGLLSVDRVCQLGGETCVTCGLTIVTAGDMIVRLCPLKGI